MVLDMVLDVVYMGSFGVDLVLRHGAKRAPPDISSSRWIDRACPSPRMGPGSRSMCRDSVSQRLRRFRAINYLSIVSNTVSDAID